MTVRREESNNSKLILCGARSIVHVMDHLHLQVWSPWLPNLIYGVSSRFFFKHIILMHVTVSLDCLLFLATGAQVVKVIFRKMTSDAQYMLLFVPSRADIYGHETLTHAYNPSIHGWMGFLK